jgi:divalent metal cation (Fe/Co/Zn/Cd) transporter
VDPADLCHHGRIMAVTHSIDRASVARRGARLQFLTMVWNSLEFVVALGAGVVSGSVALVGFGIDSAIEVSASLAALWRLRRDVDPEGRERAERRAAGIIGASFLALAAWVAYESVDAIRDGRGPETSATGILLAAASLGVMPFLARQKRRVARELASGALEAETRQTEVCAWLSAILLVGLALRAGLGWWWADAAAGLAMTPLIAREGWEALRGRTCCA